MDAIARVAGVSKQTIYSHFSGKAALFEAIILERCDRLLESLPPVADAGSNAEVALRAIATRLLELMLTPEFVARFRVVMAESGRFPELAELYYRSGPGRATTCLADYLAQLHRKGLLNVPEPHLSAPQFFGMIWGGLFLRHVLGVDTPPKSEDLARHVQTAVRDFLIAHDPG
jgi:TetR/AcrR family transcriptional regulator, mexJK operon transcriptional repressor